MEIWSDIESEEMLDLSWDGCLCFLVFLLCGMV